MSERNNLLIVAAGNSSLHEKWLTADRSYDVWIIYYGSDENKASLYRSQSDKLFVAKGMKLELARTLLLEELHFRKKFNFEQYNYVWFPDDDLQFSSNAYSANLLFETAQLLKADAFQPAIQNEHISPNWEATKLIPGAFCHRTNLVEMMGHGFSGAAFSRAYLPAIHAMEFMKSGWGIDPIWMKIGEATFRRPLYTFVLDNCPIIHTRPVGGGRSFVHMQGQWEAKFVPQIHTNTMTTIDTF